MKFISALVSATAAVSISQKNEWPSVARCNGNQMSSDYAPCDHDNRLPHSHSGTTGRWNSLAEQEWPSVARCNGNQMSSDYAPCDHDNRLPHSHSGTTGRWNSLAEQEWPSVARCNGNQMSSDYAPCDHDNRLPHSHSGTTGRWNSLIQLDSEYRPVIKCFDPETNNPVTCTTLSIQNYAPLAKDENGFTPTKVVPGGARAHKGNW